MGRLRRLLPIAFWMGCLLVAIAAFGALGRGALAGPDLTDPGSWARWLDRQDPLVAVVSVLRLVVVGLAWYLVGITTIGAIARMSRDVRLIRVADALSIPTVRRLLQSTLGIGLATAMVAASTTSPSGESAQGHTVVAMPAVEAPAGSPGDPPAMRRVEPAERDRVPAPPALQVPSRAAPTTDAPRSLDDTTVGQRADADIEPATGAAPAADDAVHTVVAGEHLWGIAREALAERLGRSPSDAEVQPYWRKVIEVNRDQLADPANPDLILPGQEFVVPPLDDALGR